MQIMILTECALLFSFRRKSQGQRDEVSIKSVVNLEQNIAPVSADIFHLYTLYTSACSHDLSQRSHVALFGRSQSVAQSCHMPISGREKRPDISEGTDLIAARNFLLHQRHTAQMACTCINYYD